jgi:hypothetical protein
MASIRGRAGDFNSIDARPEQWDRFRNAVEAYELEEFYYYPHQDFIKEYVLDCTNEFDEGNRKWIRLFI